MSDMLQVPSTLTGNFIITCSAVDDCQNNYLKGHNDTFVIQNNERSRRKGVIGRENISWSI